MNQLDWHICCRRLKAGDKSALETLFRQVYPEVSDYARLWLRDAHEAEDVAQEVFIRLWEQRERLDPQRSLRALLFVSARNRALNRLRDRKRVAPLLGEVLHTLENTQQRPETQMESASLETRLNAWLTELPERRREAFYLSRYENMRYADIAEVMNLSVKTVEQHIGAALRFLRDKIKQYEAA